MRNTRKKNVLLKRSTNKRIRGGMDTSSSPFPLLETSSSTQGPMNISDLNSSQGPMNLSDLDVTDSSDMNNTTLNTNDLSINNEQNIGQNYNLTPITPAGTNELYISLDTDLSTSTNDKTTSEERSMSFGGRKTKKYNKVRKLKKGSKKLRKGRKSRKNKRQKGGRGFTTSVTTNPIAYKEDEYDQFKNALNY
jgi:hypothetical protein